MSPSPAADARPGPDSNAAVPDEGTGDRDGEDAPPRNAALAEADEAPRLGHSLHVDRFAALVDGIEYFPAVRAALLRARHQVWITGWEVHSEIDLLRGAEAKNARRSDEPPVRFADLLEFMVERCPDLHVRLLIWKGSALFAAERQHLPRMKRPWSDHPRIQLEWDEKVPALASRHRKMVVVDDRVAFLGGMDLTGSRWDSRMHRRDDERRRPPGLVRRQADPYHEMMAAVDDDAARWLGKMSRDRWREVTGECVEPPPAPDPAHDPGEADPWPAGVEPLVRDHAATIAITEPASDADEDDGVREVEATLVQQITAARRLIFIETQYFTAETVVDALVERLRDPEGPEVVLLLPWGCPGHLQAMALDTERDRMLDRLRSAAPADRLGVYWATRDGPEPEDPHAASVYVHAKVLVVDDELLRIGSANLNRRSMGLDSECDVFLQARDDAERDRFAALRRSVIADLLAVSPERVEQAESPERAGESPAGVGVIAAIESLRGGTATLVPFDHRSPESPSTILPIQVTDPDRPLSLEDVQRVARLIRADRRIRRWLLRRWNGLVGGARHAPGRLVAALLVVATLVAVAMSPLSALSAEEMLERVESLASGPLGVTGVGVSFAVLASLGVPVTALVVATGMALTWWLAIPVSLASVLVSAAIGRAVGGGLRGGGGERPSGGAGSGESGADEHDDPPHWRARVTAAARRVTHAVHRHGTLAVAIVRNLPIAPFAVINLACGVAGIAWRPYILGTALGMLPGIVILSVLGRGVARVIEDPSPGQIAFLLVTVALFLAMLITAYRLRGRWTREDEDADVPASGDAAAPSA